MLQDHPIPYFLGSCFVSLGRLIPRRTRLIVTLGPPATTPMRMIHGIHCRSSDSRPDSEMAATAGITQNSIFMINVAHLANGGHAFAEELPDFAGRHPHLHETTFFRH